MGGNPAVCPLAQRIDHRLQVTSHFGEPVLDAYRGLVVHSSRDQAMGLELAQPAGEHLVGELRDGLPDPDEPGPMDEP